MASDAGGQRIVGSLPESVQEPANSDISPSSARHLGQLESSQAGMRDATKWLVAAAAAVGAVVVAGLQLKDLPHGAGAITLALLGVAAALAAVAVVLYRAADVLGAGYTTFGYIVDLSGEKSYIKQEIDREKWEKRLFHYQAMKRIFGKLTAKRYPRWRRAVVRWYATVAIQAMKVTRGFAIRHAKDEDLRVGELITYLNQDTFYFTQGLAVDINQLYYALKETDKDILALRGQVVGGDESNAEDAAALPAAASSLPVPAKEVATRDLTQGHNSEVMLEKAEWRRVRLENATRVLIAFANQRLLEKRFRKLIYAVIFGGAVVFLGAGAFAAAPNFGTPQPISITQPTRVTITVIGNGLGKLCPPGTVLQGVAVGGTWEEPLVVTERAGQCPAQQVTLDHKQAVAVPVLGSSPTADATPSPQQ
jgi:hypothetical protein